MEEREFNLLDEPWIKVITPSMEQKEVSLTDVMIHAHEYKDLAGEMATQDAVLLRMLLAVAVTVFYRYDANGKEEPLISEDDEEDDVEDDDTSGNTVLRRWKQYWKQGRFPKQALEGCLEAWRERFWLFHPETPFWQVKDLNYGTSYDVECLFGNVKESNNVRTRHHFSMTEGEEVNRLSYGEAARWLVHLNGYAVNLKTDKKAPGPGLPVGVGRLGRLGFVMVNGENLFQILMLNLCAHNEDKELWGQPRPAWEQAVRTEQGCERETFDNLPELYTMQSRRILLERDQNGRLTGFRAMGGDFCPLENAFSEPMTIWKEKKGDKKTDPSYFLPQTHNPAVHAWREFAVLLERKEHIPGVVRWIQTLYGEKMLPPDFLLTFRMIGMVYGDQMNYTYGDCVNDTLSMSADLLADLSRAWRSRIADQVEKCQNTASAALSHAASKLSRLLYGTGSAKNGIRDALVRQYYFSVDGPFRQWLVSIDPIKDSPDEKQAQWERQSYYYARKTLEDYVADLGTDIYMYREEESKDGPKRLLTIPRVVNEFLRELGRIYILTEDEE